MECNCVEFAIVKLPEPPAEMELANLRCLKVAKAHSRCMVGGDGLEPPTLSV